MENVSLQRQPNVGIGKNTPANLQPTTKRHPIKIIGIVCIEWLGNLIKLGWRFLVGRVNSQDFDNLNKMADYQKKLGEVEKLRVETIALKKKHKITD